MHFKMNYVGPNEIHRSFAIFAVHFFHPDLFFFFPNLFSSSLPFRLRHSSASPWGKFMAICFMQQTTNGRTDRRTWGMAFKYEWKRDGQMCPNKQVWLIHRFRLSLVQWCCGIQMRRVGMSAAGVCRVFVMLWFSLKSLQTDVAAKLPAVQMPFLLLLVN